MAGRIPQHFIDDLLARIDIIDIVDSRVKLKKTGRNYSACCPFHKEKTPSFTVSPDKQFYYCFGCGASGNALGFIMDFDHLDFPAAVDDLAGQLGLEVPREQSSSHTKRPDHSNLYDLMERAAVFFKNQLQNHPQSANAKNYLQHRGLDSHQIQQFGIGFAPPGWDNLQSHLSDTPEQEQRLIQSGMLVENEDNNRIYDRFRNRIMFPIRDSRGRYIAFNHNGTKMDREEEDWNKPGDVPQVVSNLKKIHAQGTGMIGMKLIGNGQFKEFKTRDESIKFVTGLDFVNAYTIGLLSPEQVDENIELINKHLNA